MSFYYNCLIVFGLFYCFLSTVNAINCHQCSTKEHGDACWNAKTNDAYLAPCDKDIKLCRKIHSTIGKDPSFVMRQCASETYESGPKCVERTGTKDVKMTYCECDNDGCNAAVSLHIKFALVTFISGLLSLLILS